MNDLTSLKDDMIAFVEGHGLRRFHAFVSDEVPSVTWDSENNPDAWKDFVELAKACEVRFLTVSDSMLEREDLELLTNRLRESRFPNDDDLEEARWLRSYIGKTGFIQLGFPYHGTVFLFEVATEWYDRYQRLLEVAEEFGGFVTDDPEDREF